MLELVSVVEPFLTVTWLGIESVYSIYVEVKLAYTFTVAPLVRTEMPVSVASVEPPLVVTHLLNAYLYVLSEAFVGFAGFVTSPPWLAVVVLTSVLPL